MTHNEGFRRSYKKAAKVLRGLCCKLWLEGYSSRRDVEALQMEGMGVADVGQVEDSMRV